MERRNDGEGGGYPDELGLGAEPYNASAFANAETLVRWSTHACSHYYNAAEVEARAGFLPRGKLSVVVGAVNRPITLTLLVAALRRQKLVEAVEVLVMDGGSDPPLQSLLPDLPVDVWRAWPLDGLYHRVRSFNEGVRLASHDVVAFLDDDVVPTSDYWAHAILREMALRYGDPRATNFSLQKLEILEFLEDFSDVPSRFRQIDTLHWIGPMNPDGEHKTRIGEGFFEKSTVNIAFTKSAWNKSGGFDVSLDGVYGEEDVELYRHVEGHPFHTLHNRAFEACAIHIGRFFGNQKRCSPVRDAHGRIKMRGAHCKGVPLPEHLRKKNDDSGLGNIVDW